MAGYSSVNTNTIARWLSLAAAPTFAITAVLTGIHGDGAHDVRCAAAAHASALSGMAPMYLMMTAFNVAPWLQLISGRAVKGVPND
jgi:hypothetical protein